MSNTTYEFVAWSLYTGPSFLTPIINDPDCSWVTGQWKGVNTSCSKEEIKKDIDRRIDLLIDALKKAIPLYKSKYRCFVIPEFFFRSRQGPYPNVKIDGKYYPIDYIKNKLDKLKDILRQDRSINYRVVLGSILTSNIENYGEFLESTPVIERMDELNSILSKNQLSAFTQQATRWHREFNGVGACRKNSASTTLAELDLFMQKCRANPLCTVRNRGIVIETSDVFCESYVYEKQYESTVDLTMGAMDNGKVHHGGMITEWMANYPSYNTLKGDKQDESQYSTYARITTYDMRLNKVEQDLGVEICLDHRLQRLRRSVGMTVDNGASMDNYPLCMQLIPSGGMQILDNAVAAAANMPIFNADGCEAIYKEYGDMNTIILNKQAGIFIGNVCGVYALCGQSKWIGTTDGKEYYSHSQLAYTTKDSTLGGFDNALGTNNKKASTSYGAPETNDLLKEYKLTTVNLGSGSNSDAFEAGLGELHIYNKLK